MITAYIAQGCSDSPPIDVFRSGNEFFPANRASAFFPIYFFSFHCLSSFQFPYLFRPCPEKSQIPKSTASLLFPVKSKMINSIMCFILSSFIRDSLFPLSVSIISHCYKFVNRFLKNILDFFNFYFQVPLQKAIFAPHDRNNVLGRDDFEPMCCLCFSFSPSMYFHTCLLVLSTAELKKSSRSKLRSVSAAFGFPKSFRSQDRTAALQSFIGFLPTFQPLAV